MSTLRINAIAVLAALSAWLAVSAAAFAQTAAKPSVRLIYRCEQGGVLIFSGHPCSSQAQTYEADASRVSIYEATPGQPSEGRTARRRPEKRAAAKGSIATDQAKHAANCARIRDALRDIRVKMRGGYKAQEGERLKARQEKLSARSRMERCR